MSNPSANSYESSLKYRSAINNSHPVAIRFNYKVANTAGLKYHFIVGSGWYLNGANYDNLMVSYVDPDGSISSTKNFDWSNMVKDFEFGHLEFK